MVTILAISQVITLIILWKLVRTSEPEPTKPLPRPIFKPKEKPRELEHFVPSKDLDYIMSGKRVDPFD
jgi:hypothetical protein